MRFASVRNGPDDSAPPDVLGASMRAGNTGPQMSHAPAAMSPIVPRTRKGMYGMQFDHVRSVAGRGVVDWRDGAL